MSANYIPINNHNKPEGLEKSYRPPERRFTTPWLFGDRGFFRIDVTIIGPVAQEPEYNLSLGRSQAQDVLQAIADEIVFLREELRA